MLSQLIVRVQKKLESRPSKTGNVTFPHATREEDDILLKQQSVKSIFAVLVPAFRLLGSRDGELLVLVTKN